jgi:hypothetical protein
MTGRLLSTHLPERQGCRILNFCSLAGGHSAPNLHSNGPAVLPELPPQGHPFQYPGCAGSSRQHTLDGRATSGGVLGRPRTFNSLRRQPGSNTAQDITESFGSVAPQTIGSRHGNNHEGSHDRKVVNLCRGFGNVCRVGT